MRYFILAVFVVTSSGCLMEAVTVTAIQGEMAAQSAASGNRALQKAKDSKSQMEIQSAVNSYSGTVGYFPKTLDALMPGYLEEVPIQSNGLSYGYDPQTGRVTIVALHDAPSGGAATMQFTQADADGLNRIRGAIYAYWEMTGYYPESLASLAPLYIQSIPTTSSGGAFGYNKSTGIVSHPGEFQQQAPVQQQRGPRSAAGQVDGISSGHTQRQLEVMNDLGL